MNSSSLVNRLFRAARPVWLLGSLLFYALGVGISVYLGQPIRADVIWLGFGVILCLQISLFFLTEYFNRAGRPAFEQKSTPVTEIADPLGLPRVVYLQVGAAALAVGAALTVLLMTTAALSPEAWLILGAAFGLCLAYALPPARLVYSGYGELTMAVVYANLIPAFAFLLQSHHFHRLLALITFPLTFLFLAATLAVGLRAFLDDALHNHNTLLVRAGWQRGMDLHNLLIFMAYVVLAASALMGLPWRLAFPAFLSLPVAIYQVWQMRTIANGGKPHWRALRTTALASLGLMAYLVAFTLWTV